MLANFRRNFVYCKQACQCLSPAAKVCCNAETLKRSYLAGFLSVSEYTGYLIFGPIARYNTILLRYDIGLPCPTCFSRLILQLPLSDHCMRCVFSLCSGLGYIPRGLHSENIALILVRRLQSDIISLREQNSMVLNRGLVFITGYH